MPLKPIFILSALAVMLLTGCKSEQERVLSELDTFVTESENGYQSFNDTQWEENAATYEQITQKAEHIAPSMTDSQRKQLNNLKGRYAAVQLKRLGNELGEGLKDFQQQAEGLIEGMTNKTHDTIVSSN